jgi:hypothetical protein
MVRPDSVPARRGIVLAIFCQPFAANRGIGDFAKSVQDGLLLMQTSFRSRCVGLLVLPHQSAASKSGPATSALTPMHLRCPFNHPNLQSVIYDQARNQCVSENRKRL